MISASSSLNCSRESKRTVSRLKPSANPTIVAVLRTHRGNTIDLTGKKLKDVLPHLRREVIDAEIEVSFKDSVSKDKKAEDDVFEVYHPKGSMPKAKETFRLVGILDEETNVSSLPDQHRTGKALGRRCGASLQCPRWSVELIFKELKSLYQLDVITSGAANVVEPLVLVSMLTLVVSHRILNQVRTGAAPEDRIRFTPLRWAELFYNTAFILLAGVLEMAGVKRDPFSLLCYYMNEGIDPNVNCERLLTSWIKSANSQASNGTY